MKLGLAVISHKMHFYGCCIFWGEQQQLKWNVIIKGKTSKRFYIRWQTYCMHFLILSTWSCVLNILILANVFFSADIRSIWSNEAKAKLQKMVSLSNIQIAVGRNKAAAAATRAAWINKYVGSMVWLTFWLYPALHISSERQYIFQDAYPYFESM